VGRGQDVYLNDTFLGSSASATLIVQADPIEKIPQYPLPTEYWTRPIEGQNTEWAAITSHWLGGSHIVGNYQPDGRAPNTPHIMWTKPIEFGGIVGGSFDISGTSFYSGGSYEGRLGRTGPPIIMAGRLYFELPLSHSGAGGGYICLDLMTGEEKWYRDDIAPSFGQLYNYESRNQHGVVGGVLWATSGNNWIGIDAFTGKNVYNFTGVPRGSQVYNRAYGEIEFYVLNYEDRRLALWSTAATNASNIVAKPGISTSAYQYRPLGKEVDVSESSQYLWNVTIPDLPGSSNPSITRVIPGDLILGTSTTWPNFRQSGTPDPYTLWAISDKPETRGDLLWLKNYAAPVGYKTRAPGPSSEIERLIGFVLGLQTIDPVNRVILLSDEETMQYLGYDLDTGDLLWGPTGEPYNAFQYYGGGLGGGQIHVPAYGNIYVASYGGAVQAYDTSDGTLLWEWDNINSGLETIWGVYPTAVGAIADGKVYVFNNEHSPNYPLYKGYRVFCLDAFTGDELWSLLSWAGHTGGPGTSTMVEADGFLCYYNYYDNQIYCIGKGPSATTVTGPESVQPLGTKVLIKGSVTDIAPGTNQDALAKRFPNGVPAVSDPSMGEWMEYLYMQKPCPMDVQGVEVTIDVITPDGSFDRIGTARSDGYGMFSYMWEPENEGTYTIIVTFEGSDSYWPSYAQTAVGVGPAPTPAGPIEPEAPTGLTTTEIAIIAAVVVVAIAGIAAYWILRKRK